MLYSFGRVRSCNSVAPGHAHYFAFQHQTIRNMVRPTMLRHVVRSFCRGFCLVIVVIVKPVEFPAITLEAKRCSRVSTNGSLSVVDNF